MFATKYSLLVFLLFQDLQHSHTFAPLPIQNIRKKFIKLFRIFVRISAKSHYFPMIFIEFGSDFDDFSRDFAEHSRKC